MVTCSAGVAFGRDLVGFQGFGAFAVQIILFGCSGLMTLGLFFGFGIMLLCFNFFCVGLGSGFVGAILISFCVWV